MTVWFRLVAFWRYMRGVESWGKMTREGFASRRTPPVTATVTG